MKNTVYYKDKSGKLYTERELTESGKLHDKGYKRVHKDKASVEKESWGRYEKHEYMGFDGVSAKEIRNRRVRKDMRYLGLCW